MTILLGKSPIGIAIVSDKGGVTNINNQDMYITENGVYTADEGYTGLGTVEVNVESSGDGETIEVLNNTGAVINQGDKVWVNVLAGNSDGVVVGDNSFSARSNAWGFTKDGQYLLAGQVLLKVNSDNTFTALKWYTREVLYIKHENGKTFGINTSNGMTACANYPNNWEADFIYVNDGYFVHQNSTGIRKYNLETGEIIKTYAVNRSVYANGIVVIDNILYDLSSNRGYYVFDDENNTCQYYSNQVTINNPSNRSIGCILGKTTDSKYFVDSNLNLISYLGNNTFEVLSNEKMPAILQAWSSVNKTVNFNQDTGVLVVDAETEYGIYKYDNGNWYRLIYELNLVGEGTRTKGLMVNYDLTKYAFPSTKSYVNQINVGTMQPNLKVMAQEFRWFNVNERTITGVAKTSAEPDEKFTISTVLEPEIEVTITTNADNAEILMEL